MPSNVFQSTSYRTQSQMLFAIATEWLTAGGLNDADTVAKSLTSTTDEQLAAEVIEAWGLNMPRDDRFGDKGPSHMDAEDYSADDLAEAFAEYRSSVLPLIT